MYEDLSGEIPIKQDSDAILVRKTIRDVAKKLNFSVTDVTRIVTAASELSRNICQYADSGVMRWRALEDNNRVGIELTFEDHGPGIANLEEAMAVGYSTGGGLGLGLPGSQKLMDEMEIDSRIGEGTTIIIRKWWRRF